MAKAWRGMGKDFGKPVWDRPNLRQRGGGVDCRTVTICRRIVTTGVCGQRLCRKRWTAPGSNARLYSGAAIQKRIGRQCEDGMILDQIRQRLRDDTYRDEGAILRERIDAFAPAPDLRARIQSRALTLVDAMRAEDKPSLMELFLGEYGLSSDEGVALMCLAEALLRVPDTPSIDALIEDKIAASDWEKHRGKSDSSLVNASTWSLFVTGRVLRAGQPGAAATLRKAIRRVGEPVIRQAVARVMREMGNQFVLGETIEAAMSRAAKREAQGYTYSYDMLGEAAANEADAQAYTEAYARAIDAIGQLAQGADIADRPGMSIKLSALGARYDQLSRAVVMRDLLPRAQALTRAARDRGIGLNIDAEEAARLDLSLDLIEAILSDPHLAGWDGFGVVVQAYGRRAGATLDWLHALAERLDRRIMVRLVKGAYWDTEIKRAQVDGLRGFPVFTRKPSTDVNYLCCARQLLRMGDRIYPQFATHNAHTVAAVLEMAQAEGVQRFEFQRLHGMGEALHRRVMDANGTRCRIYAPVGRHRDLLAYLVRRLLENGANSSFVNQIFDPEVPSALIAADPFAEVAGYLPDAAAPTIRQPADLFQPERRNSAGWDLADPRVLDRLRQGLAEQGQRQPVAGPEGGTPVTVVNPATGATVGTAHFASADMARAACESVRDWSDVDVAHRAEVLRRAADLYEANTLPFFDLLQREAGKTINDCVGEVREAVDFLRYYAAQAEKMDPAPVPRGIFACISPWNFPLAIFTGQIAAALVAGNGVLAKPAEATSLTAAHAVELLHRVGVPQDVLMLLPGKGSELGPVLGSHPAIAGTCFTGSTATAQIINRTMAEHLPPFTPLIAETGGLNAMIVDSTALPEQAVRDILASAFQSAGQRCSALRLLYLQEEVADRVLEMLFGAMDSLRVGDPSDLSTDVGPVIDGPARAKIDAHIARARAEGRVLKECRAPATGTFVAPTVIRLRGIADLEEEIFGPVLHVATFRAADFDRVLADVNQAGYGLTFGIHSRIDDRVDRAVRCVSAGNIYVNRNQIGAVVGSQPFGGHGLSGTGPKAGGPLYLHRFTRPAETAPAPVPETPAAPVTPNALQDAFAAAPIREVATNWTELPGPTGEDNRYGLSPRGHVLCLGPGTKAAQAQARHAAELGCRAVAVANGRVDGEALARLEDLDAVVVDADPDNRIRRALAAREGPLVPLVRSSEMDDCLRLERSICVDTTAAGGNVDLLGG